MAKIRIALQLWSVREDCARNLEKTLEAVVDMGYEGVEFAGYYGRMASELRRLLDDLGLEVAGTHIGIETLMGDKLKETIEFNRILENKFLIVPGLPQEMRSSKEAWLKTARLFNEIADRLKSEGIYVGYHNHVIEFQPINGEIPWFIFFDATRPDVIMQLDTGHAMRSGISPDGILDIIRRYPNRAKSVHLKEYSSRNEKALIGEGEMRWREFIDLCRTVGGTEWYIIEQETYAYPPLECARRCLENLKAIIG
ncbi:MAG: sugar phosphate isomerase/epimerase [Candidatus Bathyarchaeia archaeon]|nr:sugar phosphate isomerase/epimerase [Candidatus Bathyarchaeota archaeon]